MAPLINDAGEHMQVGKVAERGTVELVSSRRAKIASKIFVFVRGTLNEHVGNVKLQSII